MITNVSLKENSSSVSAFSADMNLPKIASTREEDNGVSNSENISATKDKKDISKESQIKSQNTKAPGELTEEEKKQVDKLKKIDAKVKRHEQAHLAAGGSLVRGGASFSYESGPDGKQYAVAGEVSIEMSPVDGDPEATIRKMQQVKSAALAPAEPSAQDRSVASSASSIAAQARSEMLSEKNDSGDNEVLESSNVSNITDSDAKNENSEVGTKKSNSTDNSKMIQFGNLKQKYNDFSKYSTTINAYA